MPLEGCVKLIIIRHGDPDYEHDTLTPRGWKEAAALADAMEGIEVSDYFVSPLGRAKDTASMTLRRVGRTATELRWLTEFVHPIAGKPYDPDSADIPWDWYPNDWMRHEDFFSYDGWSKTPEMRSGDISRYYSEVAEGLDKVLADYGYRREGHAYRTDKGNCETLAFFCHLGVEAVMLGHLLSISPMILWHEFCALPSSVTTLATEERQKGNVCWRVLCFGDISHLRTAGLNPSFAARFCEVYENKEQRH